MRHLGDITKIKGNEIEPVWVITGGSPCQDLSIAGNRKGLKGERSGLFMEQIRIIKEMRQHEISNGRSALDVRPRYMVWENVCFSGETLVTCENGYKRIDEVFIGDKVKTLSGEYHTVIKTYKTPQKEVIKLSVGCSEDIYVTPNHPILAIEKSYGKNKERIFSEPKYVPAGNLTKTHMVGYRIDIPTLPNDFITDDMAWAIGRWLADGSVDLKRSNPRIFISVGLKKADSVREKLSSLPYEIHENKPHETAINFCFTSSEFYGFIAQAGVGAANKRVPPYIFKLPVNLQAAVLQGYLDGDGYIRHRGNEIEISASTASRELAYGIARLIRNTKHTHAAINVKKPKDGNIDGRVIRANYPAYTITSSLTSKVSLAYFDGEIVWCPVKSVKPVPGTRCVYNLSVEGDNTYGANDIMGHNCGAFSSTSGKDFAAVLEETIGIVCEAKPILEVPDGGWPKWGGISDPDGRWSVAWRTMDAQYWGVPQRRRRIALVADFGGSTAPEILFKSESVSRNTQTSGETRERAAATTKTSTGETSGNVNHPTYCIQGNSIDRADTAGCNGKGWTEDVCYTLNTIDRPAVLCLNDQGGKIMELTVDKTATLRAQEHGHQPLVFDARGNGDGNTAPTMTGDHKNRVTDYTAIVLQQTADEVLAFKWHQGSLSRSIGLSEKVSPSLLTDGGHPPAVCYSQATYSKYIEDDVSAMLKKEGGNYGGGSECLIAAVDCRNGTENYDINGTLQSKQGGGYNYNANNCVRQNVCVRRLTPLECERLQGFPDNWTNIGEWVDTKGKLHKESTDSARYAALGNSIALPQWRMVLSVISQHLPKGATLGSLFDGIGGFPLVWEEIHGKGSAIWASEIEEFPIAVTKYHFSEN